MKTVKVMIADPFPLAVERLEKVLSADSRIEIVATATSAEECLKKATTTLPNVILMDLRFDDMGGSRLIRELSGRQLEVSVLIISTDAKKGHPMLEACLKAGAFDFIQRPGSLNDLEKITRQITTRIHVASFSKTKQIPTGDLPLDEEEPVEEGIASRPLDLDVLLIDCPGERLRELLVLLTSIEATLKPALVVLIRRPAPFAETLVEKLKGKVRVPLQATRAGDYIVPGRIFVIDILDHDLVLERNISGDVVQLARSTVPREREVPLPGIDRLLDSLARSYNNRAGAVILGGDPLAVTEGLCALKSRGGIAVIEQAAGEILDFLQGRPTGGGIHDGVLPAAELAALINRIGHHPGK